MKHLHYWQKVKKKKGRFNHYFKVLIQLNKNLVKLLN